VYYGSSYYFEYLPFDRLSEDVRMMREANVNYQRIGDSIWTLLEPEEGRFELDWLQPILDAMHGAGIKVLLATPTYAIPAWMARSYPELMAVRPAGYSVRFGGRQNVDFAHPGFRARAEPMIRAFLSRYAQHPSVIGVQVDNEVGVHALSNEHNFQRFVAELKAQYGTLDAINEIWGLNYWSHRLHDWSDLWRPGSQSDGRMPDVESGNTNPSYDLAWRRFQARLCAEFLDWQAKIAREYLRDDQFVTHDLVGGHGRAYVDRRQIHDILDLPGENVAHHGQDGLTHPPTPLPPSYHDRTGVHGAMQIYLRCDMGRNPRQRNFLVPEMTSISVGGSAHNFVPYDGQWKLAAYACLSRGAIGCAYWHWHTLHYGHEIYSGGILGHDFLPNRCYDEIARVGREWQEHDALFTGVDAEAEVGILYSIDSRYAFDFQPPLAQPGSFDSDPNSYPRIFDTFYRAFFDARAQIEVLRPEDDFSRYRVLVVPAFYIADDAALEKLAAYAEAGGHLVVSFRTGYADEHCRVRTEQAPGPLKAAVGAKYTLYSNLLEGLPLRSEGGLSLPPEARALGWMDELQLDGAEALAWYEHPHFGRFPAVTTHAHGRGRVTYVGTLPNPALGKALGAWVLDQAGVGVLGTNLPEPVRVTRARARGGERLWFLTNWSPESHEVELPVRARNVLDPDRSGAERYTIEPWGVAVLAEPAGAGERPAR
jgi:beta-galactosidase